MIPSCFKQYKFKVLLCVDGSRPPKPVGGNIYVQTTRFVRAVS